MLLKVVYLTENELRKKITCSKGLSILTYDLKNSVKTMLPSTSLVVIGLFLDYYTACILFASSHLMFLCQMYQFSLIG